MTEALLKSALTSLSAIPLEAAERVSLMNRSDTKFVLHSTQVECILSALASEYNVLDIDGHRLVHYDGVYFDTAERGLYMQHHNGRLNRVKVRTRQYIENDLSFFEVKQKINGKRTAKQRIPLTGSLDEIHDDEAQLVRAATSLDPAALSPVLRVRYARCTLVHPWRPERITIDVSLAYDSPVGSLDMGGVVVAEVKQERFSRQSEFMRLMQKMRVFPVSISKYCAGMAMTYTDLKYNRFKHKLRTLQRVSY